jgi:hypothetical protein
MKKWCLLRVFEKACILVVTFIALATSVTCGMFFSGHCAQFAKTEGSLDLIAMLVFTAVFCVMFQMRLSSELRKRAQAYCEMDVLNVKAFSEFIPISIGNLFFHLPIGIMFFVLICAAGFAANMMKTVLVC